MSGETAPLMTAAEHMAAGQRLLEDSVLYIGAGTQVEDRVTLACGHFAAAKAIAELAKAGIATAAGRVMGAL